VRSISPGTEVLFWNRLVGTNASVTIDFGDGTLRGIIDRELKHTYKSRGNYTVTLSSFDKADNPVTLKLEVKVE
jgi:PKD repeat protein